MYRTRVLTNMLTPKWPSVAIPYAATTCHYTQDACLYTIEEDDASPLHSRPHIQLRHLPSLEGFGSIDTNSLHTFVTMNSTGPTFVKHSVSPRLSLLAVQKPAQPCVKEQNNYLPKV